MFKLRLISPVIAAVAMTVQAAQAQAPVRLELVTEGPLLGAERDWLRMTEGLPATTIRIRSGRAGDRPEVRNNGSPTRPRYSVVGILANANLLVLPGGAKITLRDRAKLEAWIGRLQVDGAEAMTTPTGPFGLTREQLAAAQRQLSRSVDFSTRGLPYEPVAQRIADRWKLELRWSEEAKKSLQLNRNERVLDELEGLSGGTAMAAVLRPLGLAFAPRRSPGQQPVIQIDRRDRLKETWPLGWELVEAPFKSAPKLFESITVAIDKTPLEDALKALNGRVGLPVLMDHNNVLLQDVDLRTRVSLPEGKQLYRRIYDHLLYQAGLKLDIKLDDGKRPFLWITTLRRSSTPRNR